MNEQELINKHQKRKDRIKNIAILFLTLMLILTFFSNTIMNYSLAEVGTAYASSGTLTTKIRGDGYVEAKDPVQVTVDQESEVLKVLVKDGDEVKKGTTLFVLEGASNESLKQAQSELLTLNYDYQKALLEITVPDYEKNNTEIKYARKELENALQDIEDTKNQIQEKEQEYNKLVNAAEKAKKTMTKQSDAVADKASEISQNEALLKEYEVLLEEYENETAALTGEDQSNEDIQAKQEALTAATRAKEDAKTAYDEAQEVEEEYKDNSDIETIEGQIKEQKRMVTDKQNDLFEAQQNLTKAKNGKGSKAQAAKESYEPDYTDSKYQKVTETESGTSTEFDSQSYYIDLNNYQKKLSAAIEEDIEAATKAVNEATQELSEANQDLADLETKRTTINANAEKLAAAKQETTECQKAYKTAQAAETAAQRALDDAKSALTKANAKDIEAVEEKIKAVKEKRKAANTKAINLTNQKAKLDTAYEEAQTAYNTAKADVDSFQKMDETAMDTVNQAADEKRKALETLYVDLAATKNDDNLKQQLSELDSKYKQQEIEAKQEEIEELKKKKGNVRVKAGTAGIVQSIAIKQGEKTTPGTSMAQIQVKKNGFQLSIPVTLDQSKLVKRGDNASVLNIWDDDIKAVLSEIKTDAENPNAGRTLVFDISGNVENGTSLSISIGERTANYDLIVPTSAIREDSDGKFVLIIEEKSSPVGNRYIARKEAVTVVTQDETQSAVTASFDSYTSIITTSSKSVMPGDYVRLAS